MNKEQEMELSVIVTIVGGGRFLRKCLACLLPQVEGQPIEVIVPYDSTADGIELIARDFARANFVNMGVARTDAAPGTQAAAHEIYDRRTASGLNVARGKVVALLQDYGAPSPDWCAEVIRAHQMPYAAIGGAVEHEGTRALNWAVYFQDFGRYQLPLPEGSSSYLTDINVSYKREALTSVKLLWEHRYKEVTVNWALERQGETLWQRPQMVVYQDRGEMSFRKLVMERFSWGRLFGAIRATELAPLTRVAYIAVSPLIPLLLLARTSSKVVRGKRNRLQLLRAMPFVFMLTLTWCLGEFWGHVTGRAAPHTRLDHTLTSTSQG